MKGMLSVKLSVDPYDGRVVQAEERDDTVMCPGIVEGKGVVFYIYRRRNGTDVFEYERVEHQ